MLSAAKQDVRQLHREVRLYLEFADLVGWPKGDDGRDLKPSFPSSPTQFVSHGTGYPVCPICRQVSGQICPECQSVELIFGRYTDLDENEKSFTIHAVVCADCAAIYDVHELRG